MADNTLEMIEQLLYRVISYAKENRTLLCNVNKGFFGAHGRGAMVVHISKSEYDGIIYTPKRWDYLTQNVLENSGYYSISNLQNHVLQYDPNEEYILCVTMDEIGGRICHTCTKITMTEKINETTNGPQGAVGNICKCNNCSTIVGPGHLICKECKSVAFCSSKCKRKNRLFHAGECAAFKKIFEGDPGDNVTNATSDFRRFLSSFKPASSVFPTARISEKILSSSNDQDYHKLLEYIKNKYQGI